MMPKLNNSSSDAKEINSLASSSPLAEDSAPAGSNVSLSVPFHEEKPKLENSESKNSSNVVAPLVPNKGIEVVAMSAGFYNQKRIGEGESFVIKSFDQIGAWMKCKNPELEKKRVEFYELKKAKKAEK